MFPPLRRLELCCLFALFLDLRVEFPANRHDSSSSTFRDGVSFASACSFEQRTSVGGAKGELLSRRAEVAGCCRVVESAQSGPTHQSQQMEQWRVPRVTEAKAPKDGRCSTGVSWLKAVLLTDDALKCD